eukprot:CAMPEP_0117425444 /NCGR_PEP_ID=MMETSP0758-20121206/5707_1 /TAXON_ID=63605 /ORGANISM="Percolomonas cosmopolitus, Strain AE-1 (ATCC 50343)" /LENGTH=559 /DNA_ID=CAMNT_0005209917 /DNA_START=430 /DNA_END=2109 /DNA_ORIENTATION=-
MATKKSNTLKTLSSEYRRVPQYINLESVIEAQQDVHDDDDKKKTQNTKMTTLQSNSHQGIQMQGYVSEPDFRGHLFQMGIPLTMKPSIHYHTPERIQPLTLYTEYLVHSLMLPIKKQKVEAIKTIIDNCTLLNVEDMKGPFQHRIQQVLDSTYVYQRKSTSIPDVLSNADKRQLKNKLIDFELKAAACRRAQKRIDQSIASFNAAIVTESLQKYKKALGIYQHIVSSAQKHNDRVMECIALNHLGNLSMIMYLQGKYNNNAKTSRRKIQKAFKQSSRKQKEIVGSPHHHNMLPNGKIVTESALYPTTRKQLPSIMQQKETITMSPQRKPKETLKLKSVSSPSHEENTMYREQPSNDHTLQQLLAQATRYHEVHLVVADLYGKTIASTNLGLVNMMEGNFVDAIRRFTEAIRTSQATHQHAIETFIVPNLALALMVSRYFNEALYLLRVWLHSSSDQPFHFVISFLLLGRIALEVNMTKEAFKYFEEAQMKATLLGPIGADLLTMCNHFVTKTKTDLLMETHFQKHDNLPLSTLTKTPKSTMSIKPTKTPSTLTSPWEDD